MDINKQIVFLPDNDLQATTHFYKPFFDFINASIAVMPNAVTTIPKHEKVIYDYFQFSESRPGW